MIQPNAKVVQFFILTFFSLILMRVMNIKCYLNALPVCTSLLPLPTVARTGLQRRQHANQKAGNEADTTSINTGQPEGALL